MALQIIRNNIIYVEADAIVNTANPNVAVGQGVDYAIYTAAGWDKLLDARKQIGKMNPGEAAWTPAFDLHAKYIIHTVGPAWRGGSFGERETVAECYRKSLKLAAELGCESIAFPLIATGTYGFPKDEALRIAMAEISSFLLANEMEVMLVVYDKESFEVSGKLFSDIKLFIGDGDVDERMLSEPSNVRQRQRRGLFGRRKESSCLGGIGRSAQEEYGSGAPFESILPQMPMLQQDAVEPHAQIEDLFEDRATLSFPSMQDSLDERLKHLDKTFQQYLFMLIDRRGLTDPEVYKKANIDRKHFSKIRSNVEYTPSKKTALALAVALELSLDETKDLLSRAGLALSPSLLSDMIIEYCIETGNYDIYEINCILFKYDQPTLGA